MKTMPGSKIAQEVIQSIVILTEQRDQRSLEQSLLATLAEMLTDSESWLMDVPAEGSSHKGCGLLHGRADSLPAAMLEQGCALPISDTPVLVEHEGLGYLLAKLQDAGQERQHLLVLVQPTWTQNHLQLVTGLLRVYQNFVGLLYDSEKDTLTGLLNRRKLEATLKNYVAPDRQDRRQKDRSHGDYLAIMDLDRFKSINDNHGHLIGDEVLLVFANILRGTLRDTDKVFRYGGEEFIALLQDTPVDAIDDILERVRRNVDNHAFPVVGRVTVSIGFARLDGRDSPLEVLARADRALYFAKDNGRNQVREYESLINQHLLEEIHRDSDIELF